VPVYVYPLLRFLKVLAVAACFAGTVGAFLPRELADRRRFAYFIAGPGFGAAWACGFGLAGVTSASLLQWWVLASLALSFFSLQVVLFAVGKDGRRKPAVAALALASLVAVVALMVWRPA
jgi:hypothetical protein